ncbi:hypothetical protein RhiirC2_762386, partial [Rhizophagus irregularis]
MISTTSIVSSLQLGTGTSCFTPQERFHKAIKLPLSIEFSEDALDKESVGYQTCEKKVLVIIVGLLKDRACAKDDSP